MKWFNKDRIYFLIPFLFFSIWLVSCAKRGNLQGGPKDKTPPQLVVDKSTPNMLTNFDLDEIVLFFDEFVELKGIDKNILISPPMEFPPDIKQRGKKVTVKLDDREVLRENATYSIDFGKSIVDYNAGNILEGFKYIFATGPVIDSLSLKGKVIKAFDSAEQTGEIFVMLFDNMADSAVLNDRPFYIVKTDEEGNFKLANLRPDTFRLIAMDDKNFNYQYDLDAEGIGFADSLLVLADDSTSLNDPIKLFYKDLPRELVSKQLRKYGVLSHTYSKVVDSTLEIVNIYPTDIEFTKRVNKDTLLLYYDIQIDSFSYCIGLDTMVVKPPLRDTVFDKINIPLRLKYVDIAPWDDAIFQSSTPLSAVDTGRIIIYEKYIPYSPVSTNKGKGDSKKDSIPTPRDTSNIVADSLLSNVDTTTLLPDTIMSKMDSLVMDSLMVADSLRIADSLKVDTVYMAYSGQLSNNNLAISAEWKGGQAYTMSLLPAAVTDMYTRSNDTLNIEFTVKDSSAYNDITLRITNLTDSLSYVMELRKDKEIIKKRYIKGVIQDSVVYAQLPVGKYVVWIVEDLNNDQKWTTGDYWSQRQPEIIKRFPLQAMQSGFALDATVEWIKNETEVIQTDSTTVPSIDPKAPKSKIPEGVPNKGKRGIK